MLSSRLYLVILFLVIWVAIPLSSSFSILAGVDRLSEYVIYDDGSVYYNVNILLYNNQETNASWSSTWLFKTPFVSTITTTGMTFTGDWEPDPEGFLREFIIEVPPLSYHTYTVQYWGPPGYWNFVEEEGMYFYGDGRGGAESRFNTFTVNLTLAPSATDFEILEESSPYTLIGSDPITLQWVENDAYEVTCNVRFWGPNLDPTPGILAGQVTDASTAQPIGNANVRVVGHPELSDQTDASGYYEISIPPGDHQVEAEAVGYQPAVIQVQVQPSQTLIQDFALWPIDPGIVELISPTKMLPIPHDPYGTVEDEPDGKITAGDHVHLKPVFRTRGIVDNLYIRFEGMLPIGEWPGVKFAGSPDGPFSWIYEVHLGDFGPGETEVQPAVWMYVTNVDYADRKHSITGFDPSFWMKWEDARGYHAKEINIDIGRVYWTPTAHHDLTDGDCLHWVCSGPVEKYGAYATGAIESTPPELPSGTIRDPDTKVDAIQNVITKIGGYTPLWAGCYEPGCDRTCYGGYYGEFRYNKLSDEERRPSGVLLGRRNGLIGQCGHYSDLAIALLRSLGLPTRFVGGWGHAWCETYVDYLGEWYHVEPQGHWGNKSFIADCKGNPPRIYSETVPLAMTGLGPGAPYQSNCMGLQQPLCWGEDPSCPNCIARNGELNEDPCGYEGHQNCDYHEYVSDEYRPSTLTHGVKNTSTSNSANVLGLSLAAPVSVLQSQEFSLSVEVSNLDTIPLRQAKVEVVLKQYALDSLNTYMCDSAIVTIDSILVDSAAVVSRQVVPLLPTKYALLQVIASTDNCTTYAYMQQIINEAGTLPDLCSRVHVLSESISPNDTLFMQAAVLSDSLRVMPDASVVADVVSLDNEGFQEVVAMSFTQLDSVYRGLALIPSDAPLGNYRVSLHSSRMGYDSDTSETYFYVTNEPELVASTDATSYSVKDTIVILTEVSDRGQAVDQAKVRLLIFLAQDTLELGMSYDSASSKFRSLFVPEDLLSCVQGRIVPNGIWNINVSGEYYLTQGSDSLEISVEVPDLSIGPDDLHHLPEIVEESTYVYFVARINNVGDYTSDSTIARIYLDGLNPTNQIGADLKIPPIPPDSFFFTEVRWYSGDELGNHTIYVMVDPESTTVQSSRENDVAAKGFNILFITGDVNADAVIDLADVVYLINYLYKGGPEPIPRMESGDVNCDSVVDVADVVYLINYLFRNGPPPCGAPPPLKRDAGSGFAM